MKYFLCLLFVSIFSIIFMFSCLSPKPVAEERPENNKEYQVAYLFEYDGCKVYRFRDNGRYIYFTNCTGSVAAVNNDSIGTITETIIKRKY